jgi:hypothetical protein
VDNQRPRYHPHPVIHCPDAILRLIERFDHQLDQVKSQDYCCA